MASTSTQCGTGSPFVAPRRAPLTDLPLRNYIERPPSPLKSYSSPSKTQSSIAATSSTKPKSHSPSPSRPSSIPLDVSSRHQIFREALRKSDSNLDITLRKSSPSEDQENNSIATRTTPVFASPQAVIAVSIRAPSTPRSSNSDTSQSPNKQSSSQISLPKMTSSFNVPQSLGKKKERIRRQLLDEDEDGPAADIRAGSPSPSKMRAERKVALLGDKLAGQGKDFKEKQAMWTVWQDEEANLVDEAPCSSAEGEEEDEQDKENVRPVIRKKGTGGRLSLLATADDTESEQSFDLHEKRRKVTPLQSAS